MMKRKTIAIAAAVMAGCLGTGPAAYAEYDAATVEQVQQALNDAGFDCGTPDGIAGEMTAAAIRACCCTAAARRVPATCWNT